MVKTSDETIRKIKEELYAVSGPAFTILQPSKESGKNFLNYDKVKNSLSLDYYENKGTFLLDDKQKNLKVMELCEQIYADFNTSHPEGFTGYSPSVGDVFAIKRFDNIFYAFVDSFGFVQLNDKL